MLLAEDMIDGLGLGPGASMPGASSDAIERLWVPEAAPAPPPPPSQCAASSADTIGELWEAPDEASVSLFSRMSSEMH